MSSQAFLCGCTYLAIAIMANSIHIEHAVQSSPIPSGEIQSPPELKGTCGLVDDDECET